LRRIALEATGTKHEPHTFQPPIIDSPDGTFCKEPSTKSRLARGSVPVPGSDTFACVAEWLFSYFETVSVLTTAPAFEVASVFSSIF
jgi:hypothetical protein